eukprot:m.364852 g.364852  ORF g.364852 m.364852 type:complete len:146 (+) comp28706_c0_seq1:64-501(+)
MSRCPQRVRRTDSLMCKRPYNNDFDKVQVPMKRCAKSMKGHSHPTKCDQRVMTPTPRSRPLGPLRGDWVTSQPESALSASGIEFVCAMFQDATNHGKRGWNEGVIATNMRGHKRNVARFLTNTYRTSVMSQHKAYICTCQQTSVS